MLESNRTTLSNKGLKLSFPTNSTKLMMLKLTVVRFVLRIPNTSSSKVLQEAANRKFSQVVTGVVPTMESLMTKSENRALELIRELRELVIRVNNVSTLS